FDLVSSAPAAAAADAARRGRVLAAGRRHGEQDAADAENEPEPQRRDDEPEGGDGEQGSPSARADGGEGGEGERAPPIAGAPFGAAGARIARVGSCHDDGCAIVELRSRAAL